MGYTRWVNLALVIALAPRLLALLRFLRIYGFKALFQESIRYIKKALFIFARKAIPAVGKQVQNSVDTAVSSVQSSVVKEIPGRPPFKALPPAGLSGNQLREALIQYQSANSEAYLEGRVSGAIYSANTDLLSLVTEAFGMFYLSNPLHPDLFSGVRQMESEIIAMVLTLYKAPEGACGNVTSGGTESLLMAIKTCRDFGKEVKGITKPEIIAPETIHAAFHKAASYFNIDLILLPIDPKTSTITLQQLKNAISRNTIMIAGSAPNFPHGIMDDIPSMAKLAKSYNIPFHVDACLGGFLLPFMSQAGYSLPFVPDFTIDGVTSISVDTHKYGFAPKGSSVIMYRSKELRKYQYFVTTIWPGGIYASPTIAGSRAGALLACCWTALMHMGENGYVQSTREIISAARKIKTGLKKLSDIEIIGEPLLSVIAFTSKNPKLNIYSLGEYLDKKEWHLNVLQRPPSIHIACTLLTTSGVESFLEDLKAGISNVLSDPNSKGGDKAAIYGAAASIPDPAVVEDVVFGFLDALTLVET